MGSDGKIGKLGGNPTRGLTGRTGSQVSEIHKDASELRARFRLA
jgi:hypothetical protein